MSRLLLLLSFVLMMSGCALRAPVGTVYVEMHAESYHPYKVHPHVRVHPYHKYGCYPCWKIKQQHRHYHPKGHYRSHKNSHHHGR